MVLLVADIDRDQFAGGRGDKWSAREHRAVWRWGGKARAIAGVRKESFSARCSARPLIGINRRGYFFDLAAQGAVFIV